MTSPRPAAAIFCGKLLRGWCGRGEIPGGRGVLDGGAGRVLQGMCCRVCIGGRVLQRVCCRASIAEGALSGVYCRAEYCRGDAAEKRTVFGICGAADVRPSAPGGDRGGSRRVLLRPSAGCSRDVCGSCADRLRVVCGCPQAGFGAGLRSEFDAGARIIQNSTLAPASLTVTVTSRPM